MDFEDRINVPTPEGIEVALTLAGPASRFVAGVVDLFLKLFLIGLVGLGAALLGGFSTAVVAIVGFVVYYGYDVLFETRANGRTPGKRWSGLRVVTENGGPIDFTTSAIRNIVRLLDGITFAYVPTLISILVTKRNQRPGDLVANTVVVRERHGRFAGERPAGPPLEVDAHWDVGGVSEEELVAVRRFLLRRDGLAAGARTALAERLALALGAKVAGAPEGIAHEEFLERLARAKAPRI